MPKFSVLRGSLMGVVGTIGLFAGFTSNMDRLAISPLQAGDVRASSSATAKSSSSASSTSSTAGGCHAETSASAEATTVVNGETKTVRQEHADRSDECGGRANSEAKAAIGGPKPEDGAAGQ